MQLPKRGAFYAGIHDPIAALEITAGMPWSNQPNSIQGSKFEDDREDGPGARDITFVPFLQI
jgi:hypothetical protein